MKKVSFRGGNELNNTSIYFCSRLPTEMHENKYANHRSNMHSVFPWNNTWYISTTVFMT